MFLLTLALGSITGKSTNYTKNNNPTSTKNHTLCYKKWQDLHSTKSSNHHKRNSVRIAESEKEVKLKYFQDKIGSQVVSGDVQAVCGKSYKDDSISACLWTGEITTGKNKLETGKPGWLQGSNTENCKRKLFVKKLHNTNANAKVKTEYIVVTLADGCSMFVKNGQEDIGCNNIWLTKGAWEMVGASAKERDSGKIQLEWTL
ncbi:hypothetical protein CROQUDRAFT_670342 [Cronartium quercuum f. sp. fusiforme G11]|uniref:Uncharacterized protein n=1 Tax=Cronartium quercuum f. sp. fusiforme G11 TaxID=708437 RepID=A0A9P6NQK3_9BASI|nr:hypothetical protein CROQUDRAFT_670342 [Cronartium quercuum f. sp. fusiforme G11]